MITLEVKSFIQARAGSTKTEKAQLDELIAACESLPVPVTQGDIQAAMAEVLGSDSLKGAKNIAAVREEILSRGKSNRLGFPNLSPLDFLCACVAGRFPREERGPIRELRKALLDRNYQVSDLFALLRKNSMPEPADWTLEAISKVLALVESGEIGLTSQAATAVIAQSEVTVEEIPLVTPDPTPPTATASEPEAATGERPALAEVRDTKCVVCSHLFASATSPSPNTCSVCLNTVGGTARPEALDGGEPETDRKDLIGRYFIGNNGVIFKVVHIDHGVIFTQDEGAAEAEADSISELLNALAADRVRPANDAQRELWDKVTTQDSAFTLNWHPPLEEWLGTTWRPLAKGSEEARIRVLGISGFGVNAEVTWKTLDDPQAIEHTTKAKDFTEAHILVSSNTLTKKEKEPCLTAPPAETAPSSESPSEAPAIAETGSLDSTAPSTSEPSAEPTAVPSDTPPTPDAPSTAPTAAAAPTLLTFPTSGSLAELSVREVELEETIQALQRELDQVRAAIADEMEMGEKRRKREELLAQLAALNAELGESA